MRTMWIDGYNATAHHMAENVDFAIRLTPGYNMLDLTPQGRGDWFADLSYEHGGGVLTEAR